MANFLVRAAAVVFVEEEARRRRYGPLAVALQDLLVRLDAGDDVLINDAALRVASLANSLLPAGDASLICSAMIPFYLFD